LDFRRCTSREDVDVALMLARWSVDITELLRFRPVLDAIAP